MNNSSFFIYIFSFKYIFCIDLLYSRMKNCLSYCSVFSYDTCIPLIKLLNIHFCKYWTKLSLCIMKCRWLGQTELHNSRSAGGTNTSVDLEKETSVNCPSNRSWMFNVSYIFFRSIKPDIQKSIGSTNCNCLSKVS